MRKIVWFLLIAITMLGLVLRVYRINQYPVHLGHDEVSQLYDAISIAQTGKDIYGHRLPFMFDSVNDFKPPFYTYMTVIWYWLLGWQEVVIKITGLVFGTLLIPVVFFFTNELFKKTQVSLATSFITAISPFEIFFSRKSFENQAGIVFIFVGFTLLLRFVRDTTKKKLANIGMALLGIGMYTYFSHAILIPLLLTGFLFLNFKVAKKIPKTGWVVLVVLALPLYWNILTNEKSTNRGGAVFIAQDRVLGEKLNFTNSFLGKKIILFDYAFNRYLSQFNSNYLFGNGLDLTKQTYPDTGLLYLIQLPFILIGIYGLFKGTDRKNHSLFLIFILLVGMIPSGLTFEEYSPHRSLIAFSVLNIISAYGLNVIWKRRIVGVIVMLCLVLGLLSFTYFYTINYPTERSFDLHYPFKQVAILAWEKRDNYDQIIFDPKFGEDAPKIGTATHYYFGFYGHYLPAEMQKNLRYGLRDREVLFDKFSIRAIDWRQDSQLKKVLLIASPWSLPPIEEVKMTGKVISEIKFFNGKTAFFVVEL